jgi:hypothetical protein
MKPMKNDKSESRKPYVKPDIRRVQLKPEESLVAGCKTLSTSASGGPALGPCDATSCFNIGS